MENNQINSNKTYQTNSIDEKENMINMDTFISKLKDEDTLYRRLSGFLRWLYIGLILVYTLKTIFLSRTNLNVLISDICFIIAAIFFIIILSYYIRVYKKVDYSAPLYQMLKNAAERYRFSVPLIVLICIPLVIMDIGLSFDFMNEPFGSSPLMRILIVQAFYVPLMTGSLYLGFWIWKKKQKPLRDNALKMLKDLES
jgi:uncharacterized membrane protein YesL